MASVPFTESVVEEAALAWLESMGWQVAFGPALAPDGMKAERDDYREPLLADRLAADAKATIWTAFNQLQTYKLKVCGV